MNFNVKIPIYVVDLLIKINEGLEPYFNTNVYDQRFLKLVLKKAFELNELVLVENSLDEKKMGFIKQLYIHRVNYTAANTKISSEVRINGFETKVHQIRIDLRANNFY